ncbi:hypothetical protein GUITHDRAFT_43190, partial [Guillardia theta CCMP2712]
PRRVYFPRDSSEKTTRHWGQRKLLMCEIKFILDHCNPGIREVLYIGAHLLVIADLFPDLHFTLIDPSPFHSGILAMNARFRVINRLFDESMAEEYKGRTDLLVISDIRSANYRRESTDENELKIHRDMALQAVFVKIINPAAAILKFQLPWSDGKTKYLDGYLMLPIWGPCSTTECRLVVRKDAGLRLYDNREYEEQLFWFNTVRR